MAPTALWSITRPGSSYVSSVAADDAEVHCALCAREHCPGQCCQRQGYRTSHMTIARSKPAAEPKQATDITPFVTTGIAHKDAGVGQVGVGHVRGACGAAGFIRSGGAIPGQAGIGRNGLRRDPLTCAVDQAPTPRHILRRPIEYDSTGLARPPRYSLVGLMWPHIKFQCGVMGICRVVDLCECTRS